jgi:hypothetical protein
MLGKPANGTALHPDHHCCCLHCNTVQQQEVMWGGCATCPLYVVLLASSSAVCQSAAYFAGSSYKTVLSLAHARHLLLYLLLPIWFIC